MKCIVFFSFCCFCFNKIAPAPDACLWTMGGSRNVLNVYPSIRIQLFLHIFRLIKKKNPLRIDWIQNVCVSLFVLIEKLYNVDEAVLSAMEEKHRILSDQVERLEKESQTVSRLSHFIGTVPTCKIYIMPWQLFTYMSVICTKQHTWLARLLLNRTV